MLKQVLIGLMILVLAVFAYVGYSSYDARRAADTGDVFPSESRGRAARADMRVLPNDNEAAPVLPAMPPTSGQTTSGQTTSGQNGEMMTPQGAPAPNAPPSDTIRPDPPNGMVFSGTGRFQLYRQGNITWRLNTDTGRSCVLFATDEEWRKPKVYEAGCAGK